jgi:ribosomal protein S18 acetylase RimI-like enzyme
MSALSIRRATTADAAAIARLEHVGWRDGYRDFMSDHIRSRQSLPVVEARVRSALATENDGTTTFIALSADRPIGFCTVRKQQAAEHPDSTAGEIADLYVDPSEWRRGVGRELLKAGLNALHTYGRRAATLWTFSENTRAKRFYEHFGFRVDGAWYVRSDNQMRMERMRVALDEGTFALLDRP